jgi:predicted metal-binding protein
MLLNTVLKWYLSNRAYGVKLCNPSMPVYQAMRNLRKKILAIYLVNKKYELYVTKFTWIHIQKTLYCLSHIIFILLTKKVAIFS